MPMKPPDIGHPVDDLDDFILEAAANALGCAVRASNDMVRGRFEGQAEAFLGQLGGSDAQLAGLITIATQDTLEPDVRIHALYLALEIMLAVQGIDPLEQKRRLCTIYLEELMSIAESTDRPFTKEGLKTIWRACSTGQRDREWRDLGAKGVARWLVDLSLDYRL